jgi:hypothetical protein
MGDLRENKTKGGLMTKKKQVILPGVDDPNGKIIDTMTLFIPFDRRVDGIEQHKLDDGGTRLILGDVMASGETTEDAIRAFKRAYKQLTR